MTSTLVKVPFVDLTLQHQSILPQIEQAIATVIGRGDFVLGQELQEFEDLWASACEVKHGVGVASGTDAITIGLQALGIGTGDEVLVPANTFIATVIGVIAAGATPVLVDCDPRTALIDLEAAARSVNRRTKAILPVHLYGQMVSPLALLDFAASHNLAIFEDAAQAHLATREGYRAGSVGRAAAFSFYPSKNLGAFGNGGMLIAQDEEVAQKARTLRNYGAPSKYFHTEYGKNSRLDTIQAAILKIKQAYLQTWNQKRAEAAAWYDSAIGLSALPGIASIENHSSNGHVYHLYVIRIHRTCPISRQEIREILGDRGIQTGIHYPVPCHLQPAYKSLGYQFGDFPAAEMLSNQILSLPMYPGLKRDQVEFVCRQLELVIAPLSTKL